MRARAARVGIVAVVALLALGCGRGAGAIAPTPSASVPSARWALVELLASDALEGRAPGSAGGVKARAAIIAELERCGVKPAHDGRFEQATAGPGVNIVGHVQGREPGRHVVLSAHYDHLGVHDGEIMNGADDNAAAVGSVVAAACELAKAPRAVTLIVALWDAEEPPHFLTPTMGSRHWVDHPHVPLSSVEAAIVLDLVGGGLWPGSPLHVALGAESSPALAEVLDQTPVPAGLVVQQAGLHLVERLVTGQHQPWSDYDAFRRREVPFVFLSNGQSERYHTPEDDFATLDLDKLERQTTWLVAFVAALLERPAAQRPRWAPSSRPEVDRAAARRLVEGALAAGGLGAREVLEADLAALAGSDVARLRVVVQRVQCLAARRYPASLCARLGG